jgi:signal transduction histidine kinase
VSDSSAVSGTPQPAPPAIAYLASWLLLIASLLILAGWQFRLPALKGAMLGTFVAPNTALLLILAVLSVRLQWRHERGRRAGVILGALAGLFAAVMVLEHLLGVETGLSRLFFAHRLDDWSVPAPLGRIAMPTALGLALAGISLVTLRWRSAICELAASGVAALGYLALVGYLFDVRDLYGRVMALPTAFLLLLLALMLFTASERRWLLSLVATNQAGSLLWKRVGPALALVIPAFGFVKLYAQEHQYVSLQMGAALFVVFVVFAFTFILLNTAVELNALDAERRAAMETLLRNEKFAATGRLAATVAHEINNPLEAATNLIYLANSNAGTPPETQRLLEMADQELRRVAHITRQTLGFYRGESAPQAVRLQQVVQDVRDLLARKITETGATVTQSGDDGYAWADPNEVRQVVSNLITNAVDATASAAVKRVEIAVANGAAEVTFTVADTGPGIPPAHRARLFEPFFSTKPNMGTGLGLYVTRQLVEKNGGSIRLETDVPHSEFRTLAIVSLPAATESQGRQASA